MQALKILILLCLTSFLARAQADKFFPPDTLSPSLLEEITVLASKPNIASQTPKPLASIDVFLEQFPGVDMIKRGAYAWEPYFNGMGSERNIITIDGMRIYGACTDKMDPVTSYLETANLEKASFHNGTASEAGASIGGTLDLIKKKSSFEKRKMQGIAFTGFESNNKHFITGASANFSRKKYFADFDLSYRNAQNYKAGNKQEVNYSQFTKYNTAFNAGYKLNQHQHLEASLIYDKAIDIGYPALPMDVSLAEAYIASLSYTKHHLSKHMHLWETKIYYNNVRHIMDDSKRPIVPIRMDMPGWSRTSGFYSKLQGTHNEHNWKTVLSAHQNYAYASMTMYADNPDELPMYMLTWPGVQTIYGDLFIKDEMTLNPYWQLHLNSGMGLHRNRIKDELGLSSLRIFYPHLDIIQDRILPRLDLSILRKTNHWKYTVGANMAVRAPSVSEAYGFYLFNSFDKFDYIGNPYLKNEKAYALKMDIKFNTSKFVAAINLHHFYFQDYIIGIPQRNLSTMTIGAAGVKKYEQINYAQIFNSEASINYSPVQWLSWNGKLSYRRGWGAQTPALPLIQPFSYSSTVSYNQNNTRLSISMQGAAKQKFINEDYGEHALKGYFTMDVKAAQQLSVHKTNMLLNAGVENIFDRNYTTFADWNRIPRMGRNFFINCMVYLNNN